MSHVAIIDPAARLPELEAFNQMALTSPLKLTYHLPGLFGLESLQRETDPIAGIIVLGSKSSVHVKLPWQAPVAEWVKKRMEAKIPTLGICYGHQMIAHSLGGQIGYVQEDKQTLVGFRKVELKANRLWKDKPMEGELFVSHQEIVTTIPPGMELVGSSGRVKVEALAHKTLPVWTFQPHPEATLRFLKLRCGKDSTPEACAFGNQLIQYFFDFVTRGLPR